MGNLARLKRFFLTGTTEGDLHLLQTAFVYDDAFARASAPPTGSPRILVGKKGAGKTAMVQYLRLKLEAEGVPVVLLRPDDFNISVLGSSSDLATIKRAVFPILTLAVAHKLSKSGELARRHRKTLNAAARAYRKGHADSVQRLLEVLVPIGKAVSKIDFKAMLPDHIPSPDEVAEAIRSDLGDQTRVAYLTIDDTDQIGAPHEASYLPRIWGLLLAVRQLATAAPNLRCLVTLRSEVWRRLRWDTRGQRDQVDHFQPLVVEWLPANEQIERIWRRRLDLAAESTGDPVDVFFETRDVSLPLAKAERRLWGDFLVKNARERPRDLIQLMGKIADAAIRSHASKISSEHMHGVIGEYSSERVDYIAEEFAEDCDTFKDVIRTLAKLQNVVTTHELMNHLKGVPSSFRVAVRGQTLQAESRDDAFVLWKLLHEAGVVNGLIGDRREARGFRHINFSDDPDLVGPSRWNDMQRLQWEIHPAFRCFLRSIREERTASQGISGAELLRKRRSKYVESSTKADQ